MSKSTIHFIGLGGDASGSGFLYTYLQAHPEICMPKQAIHFFQDRELYAKGADWYMAHFASCHRGTVMGEAGSRYLETPDAVERIARTYPKAKLLAVVCNPVERVYREYDRSKKEGSIPGSMNFSQYLEAYPHTLERGLFGKQLHTYLDLYSPVQLLILVHEDRYKGPVNYMQRVYRFLEVDDTFVPKPLRRFVTIDPDNPPPRPWYYKLARVLFFPFWLLRLNRLFGWIWNKIQPYLRKWLSAYLPEPSSAPSGPQPAPISDELRQALNEYYAADVRVLSDLLARDLNTEWEMPNTRSDM